MDQRIFLIFLFVIFLIMGVYATTTISDKQITTTGNITVEGIVSGASPVEIAGINIFDNVFELMEDRNSTSRFVLQNTNGGSNATTLITAKNDVGNSMSIGIASSNFILGGDPLANITALLSRSVGDTFFANFYDQPFRWMINPQDDADPNNLVEVMKLDMGGLNVSGNYTGDLIQLMTPEPKHICNSDTVGQIVYESNGSKGDFFGCAQQNPIAFGWKKLN